MSEKESDYMRAYKACMEGLDEAMNDYKEFAVKLMKSFCASLERDCESRLYGGEGLIKKELTATDQSLNDIADGKREEDTVVKREPATLPSQKVEHRERRDSFKREGSIGGSVSASSVDWKSNDFCSVSPNSNDNYLGAPRQFGEESPDKIIPPSQRRGTPVKVMRDPGPNPNRKPLAVAEGSTPKPGSGKRGRPGGRGSDKGRSPSTSQNRQASFRRYDPRARQGEPMVSDDWDHERRDPQRALVKYQTSAKVRYGAASNPESETIG